MKKDTSCEIGTCSKNQAESMLKFVNRVKQTLISSVFIVIVLVFFLVFEPMQAELKKSLTENFAQISQTNCNVIENNIQRCIEGGKSLSSRTMIKNAIGEYNKGNMSLEELKTFTQEKYEDGAKAIDYIILAERFVDGNIIAMYQVGDSIFDESSMEFEKDKYQSYIKNYCQGWKSIYCNIFTNYHRK